MRRNATEPSVIPDAPPSERSRIEKYCGPAPFGPISLTAWFHTEAEKIGRRRGFPGLGQAAVQVHYEGEDFYIPKPVFGTIDEARSLQVLDLVSTALALQTTKDELPKSNTGVLITAR